MRAQGVQPDNILQYTTLVLKRTPAQFYHKRLALEILNIRQRLAHHLCNKQMITNNIALRRSRKGYRHGLFTPPHSSKLLITGTEESILKLRIDTERRQSGGLRKSIKQVRVLHRLTGGAFYKII